MSIDTGTGPSARRRRESGLSYWRGNGRIRIDTRQAACAQPSHERDLGSTAARASPPRSCSGTGSPCERCRTAGGEHARHLSEMKFRIRQMLVDPSGHRQDRTCRREAETCRRHRRRPRQSAGFLEAVGRCRSRRFRRRAPAAFPWSTRRVHPRFPGPVLPAADAVGRNRATPPCVPGLNRNAANAPRASPPELPSYGRIVISCHSHRRFAGCQPAVRSRAASCRGRVSTRSGRLMSSI